MGHAYSAVLGHARARAGGGRFLLRIEDLDQTRCRPEFVAGIDEDLRWLGLDWDDSGRHRAAAPGESRGARRLMPPRSISSLRAA